MMRKIWYLCIIVTLQAIEAFGSPLNNGYKPLSDENSCLYSLHQQMGNTLTTTTSGIVGVGWDDLTNKMTLPIFATKFDQCKTTPDGHFLIPDNVLAIPVQEVFIDRSARSYKSYNDVEKETIRANRKEFSSFVGGGAYSTGNQEIKKHFSNGNTMMFEAQIGYKAFTFIAEPKGLDWAFQKRIDEIIESLDRQFVDLARYQAECIIRDYGTHVVNKALTGASMKYKAFVSTQGSNSHDATTSKMESEAAVTFLGLVGGGEKSTSENKNINKNAFEAQTQYSTIETKGGSDVRKILNSKEDDGLTSMDNIVGLEHEGIPLYLVVQKSYLADDNKYNTSIILHVQNLILNATKEYYSANTVRGCTDPLAKNFDYQTNVDDKSCDAAKVEFLFDGVFQRCERAHTFGLFSLISQSAENLDIFLCAHYTVNHPLTKNTSCPEGYDEVLLKARTLHSPPGLSYFISMVVINTYWCRRKESTSTAHKGALFGGFTVDGGENIVTKTHGCPSGYQHNSIFENVNLCVCYNYEVCKNSIPFGGFYSCENEIQECPAGYEAHLLKIVSDCTIFYCVPPSVHSAVERPLEIPPFIKYAEIINNTEDEIPIEFFNKTISTISDIINSTNHVKDIMPSL